MSGYKLKKNIALFRLKIFFTFTNNADPDEMQHYAAFHQGLQCLQKCLFRGFLNTKGLNRLTRYWSRGDGPGWLAADMLIVV